MSGGIEDLAAAVDDWRARSRPVFEKMGADLAAAGEELSGALSAAIARAAGGEQP